MWCVSHKCVILKEEIPQYSILASEETPLTHGIISFWFEKETDLLVRHHKDDEQET